LGVGPHPDPLPLGEGVGPLPARAATRLLPGAGRGAILSPSPRRGAGYPRSGWRGEGFLPPPFQDSPQDWGGGGEGGWGVRSAPEAGAGPRARVADRRGAIADDSRESPGERLRGATPRRARVLRRLPPAAALGRRSRASRLLRGRRHAAVLGA